MTSMWKFNNSTYAYQTNDRLVADRMKRRKRFYLFNMGWNCNHWVFHVKKKNQRDALNTLQALINQKPKYNINKEVWEG